MSEPLLTLDRVTRRYPPRRGNRPAVALDGVSLTVRTAGAMGVMGPSGAGKSTLARMALGLERPSSGNVFFRGRNLWKMKRGERHRIRKEIQIIWQDPVVYLNPYYTTEQLITEPMEIFGIGRKSRRRERAVELLETVGLSEDCLHARPHELSTGQCQRIAIARALATEPTLLVCDEALSSLDLHQQVEMLRMLLRLQKEMGLAYLFVSHDPDLVRILCPEAVLIRGGRVRRRGAAGDVLTQGAVA